MEGNRERMMSVDSRCNMHFALPVEAALQAGGNEDEETGIRPATDVFAAFLEAHLAEWKMPCGAD